MFRVSAVVTITLTLLVPNGALMTKSNGDAKNTLYCSFCGKSQHEVRKLIAGPTVFICDECVELCMDIIREENKTSLGKEPGRCT